MWDQNPKFSPLSEMTSISPPILCGSSPPPPSPVDIIKSNQFRSVTGETIIVYQNDANHYHFVPIKRCSLIEPGPVSTSFGANLLSIGKESDSPPIDDETKQLLENLTKKLHTAFTTVVQTPDEVAQVIQEAILTEQPHLRYQTNKNYAAATAAKLTDPTGDKPIELVHQRYFS